jgi:RNA polymerase-binding transcription factor DksA
MLTMKRETQSQNSRPASEYERLEYVRCEVCGGPIARGELPQGPYATPFYIQCHNSLPTGRKCNHRNRFPR